MARSSWCGLLAIAAAMAIIANASAGAGDDGLNAFLATYQCSLAGLIAKIHAHNQPNDRDRFITISLPGPTAAYVQCAFDRHDREALCEASSGWWNNPWEKPHFSSDEVRALAQLGFSTDGSHGNFQKRLHFPPGGPDPYTLARMMLSALQEGYGGRKEMPVEVVAPFALRHGYLRRQRCALIS